MGSLDCISQMKVDTFTRLLSKYGSLDRMSLLEMGLGFRTLIKIEEYRRAWMKCISPSEIEKMGLSFLKEYIRSKTERICPNEQIISLRLYMPDTSSTSKTVEIEKDELLKMVTTKAEKTNVLRQQVYALKEIFEKSQDNMKPCYSNMQIKYWEAADIADASYQVLLLILAAIDEWLESRKKLFIVLLAVLLLGNNDDCKPPARPDRGKISCITVYLLGNDGAHSYNGNGIRFTIIINIELADQLRHAEPPSDVLLRQPTDREQATITRDFLLRQPTDREQATITRDVLLRQPTDVELTKIAPKIGEEYVRLALLLGITRAELDHIREENITTVGRIFHMLLKWRKSKGSNATIEKLADALEELGYNADIVYSSLDEA